VAAAPDTQVVIRVCEADQADGAATIFSGSCRVVARVVFDEMAFGREAEGEDWHVDGGRYRCCGHGDAW
jgi:hypothetical protein